MLNIRSRIFIMVSVVILIILGVVILISVLTKDKTPEEENPVSENNQMEEGNFDSSLIATKPVVVPAGTKIKTPTTEEIEKNAVIQLAKIFTERYGTYSTHGDYENIKEVLPLSTENFAAVLSEKIPVKNGNSASVYQGVTTQAIATEITDWQNGAASVTVNVIKTETKDGQTNSTNQIAEVELKKVGEDWLVNGFVWK